MMAPSTDSRSAFTLASPPSTTITRKKYDVLIVGAGIAGCAAAKAFARQGRDVLLVERSLKKPHRIVGELLQPGGVAALAKLAMRDCLEGIDAIPVGGHHVYWKGEGVTFWYPPRPVGIQGLDYVEKGASHQNMQQHSRSEGRSFHHGKFVMKLRDAARQEPKVKIVETTAIELLRDPKMGQVVGAQCSNGGMERENYYAHLTVLADGSASKFRSQLMIHKPKAKSKFWGLELSDVKLPTYGLACSLIGAGPPIVVCQTGAPRREYLTTFQTQRTTRYPSLEASKPL